jgi:hypothetical protein
MRAWLLAGLLCLALTGSGVAAVDLSGTWALDLKASDSPDPMTKRMGVSGIQRGLMDSAKLVSTYTQTAAELTIVSHATGFSRTEQFRLEGRPESQTEAQTGPYTPHFLVGRRQTACLDQYFSDQRRQKGHVTGHAPSG